MAILDEFLLSIQSFLKAKDADNLRLWLRVEPPLPHHSKLGLELKAAYKDTSALDRYITKQLPDNYDAPEEGSSWPGFLALMKEYLEFWRDVNFDDLLETHSQLTALFTYVIVLPIDAAFLTASQYMSCSFVKSNLWYNPPSHNHTTLCRTLKACH